MGEEFSGSLRTFVSLLTEVGPSLLFLRCSSSGGRESRPLPRSRLLSAPNPLLRRTPSREDQEPRKQILRQNMEGFSLSMSSDTFNEELMYDLEEIVNKDLEKDPDFVSLYSIGSNHKGFERQPSYLEIFSEIESKDPLGTFNESTLFFNNYNNNVSAKQNNVVAVKQERTSSLTGYSHYSPSSPTDSRISTEDFPAELDELNEQYEIQLADKMQLAGKQVDATVDFQASEEEKEEQSDDSDEDYVPEYTKPAKRKRRSQIRDAEKDDLSSDPDFDPEEFEEMSRPSKRRRKQKEKTSDYESEEFSEEEKPQRNPAPRRYRRPSKNPVPQQRKKGSTLKISQWIVKLLRDPETNPSVIMWEDEPAGKFRVINSTAFAQLWAVEKKNPAMNYEKLSRAMRYYYRNKEIEMVKGERLTYKFGPNMRDFRAKDRNDPNFQLRA